MAGRTSEHQTTTEPGFQPGISGAWRRGQLSGESPGNAVLEDSPENGVPDIATRLLLRLANFVANMGMGVENTLDALEEAHRTGAPTLEHIQAIRDSMHRMARYVRDVEALLTPAVSSVTASPGRVIESCLESLSSAEDCSRTVLGRFPLDLWPIALGPEQFEATLFHVLTNALEATREVGEVELEAVNVALTDERASLLGVRPGEYVRIAVRDTGVGLEPHVASRAFEPFFSTWGQDQPWRGLGLTKVRSYVDGSGGACRLRSVAQRGTCVTLLLPRAREPFGTVREEQREPTRGFPQSTFLIVDDEPLVSGGLARSLTRAGHHVEVARDAARAKLILDSGTRVDVAVVDWHLGSSSGVDVARAIRDAYPKTTVVLTTGYAGTLSGSPLADEALPFLVLRKPFTTQKLLDTVLEERTRAASLDV